MKMESPTIVLLAIALSSPLSAPVANAAAAQIIVVTLQDASADPSIAGMAIKTDHAKVKAGRVTLEAINQSKNLVHELLVVPAPEQGKELPYDITRDNVVERRVHSFGEIPELKPGARGRLTLTLNPGTYLLLCNQPGHYKAGMSTTLVVEK